jgi:hypothetical protein
MGRVSGRPFFNDLAKAAHGCRAHELARLAATAAQGADVELAELARSAPPPPFACRAGCAWCCHVLVVVSVAEVARIVRHLQATLDEASYTALHERCVALAAERHAMSAARWNRARHACPLLIQDQCSVYPVRPFACRGMNSLDASACQREYEARAGKLPIYSPQQQLFGFTREAIARGVAKNGGPGLLELIPALAIGMRLGPERFLDRKAWARAEYQGLTPHTRTPSPD